MDEEGENCWAKEGKRSRCFFDLISCFALVSGTKTQVERGIDKTNSLEMG